MTLNDHFSLKSVTGQATNDLAFLPFGQKKLFESLQIKRLPIYCQRQKCSPVILVSSNVRFIWIFAGICWRGGGASNESGVVVNGDFHIFRSPISSEPSYSRPQYCTMQPLSGSSLTPKRMTFNDLGWSFYVKICFGLSIQCVGVLAFGEYCSEICSTATHILLQRQQKMYPSDCTGDISVMGVFIGVTEEEASNQ